MRNKKNQPPVYFIPDDNMEKRKTFMLIKTGTKSYAMSITNLLSSKKTDLDYKEKIYKKG